MSSLDMLPGSFYGLMSCGPRNLKDVLSSAGNALRQHQRFKAVAEALKAFIRRER